VSNNTVSRILRRVLVVPTAAALAAALVVASASGAAAYGTDHVYQITLSENCMNPVACVASPSNPFGIGGIWGWIEPDSDQSAEAALEFQGHQNAQPFLNGAGHITGDPGSSWVIISSPTPPPFTPLDPTGHYIVVTLQTPFGPAQFAFPATPGHYGATFGPGMSTQITVTLMH
jgi:hypothetical protein